MGASNWEIVVMPQSKLLVHPACAADGVGHHITPASAGWRYVGFETRTLKQGAQSKLDTGGDEFCIVILSGKARVTANGFEFGDDRRTRERVRWAALVGLSARTQRGDDRGGVGLRAGSLLRAREWAPQGPRH